MSTISLTDKANVFAAACQAEAEALLEALCVIPAPSGKEHARAAFCRDWLQQNGADGVIIDALQNVVYPIDDDGVKPLVLVCAHSDVVFADETALPLEKDGDVWRCPGIGDDTANVVSLLMAAKFMAAHPRQASETGLVVAVNSCEEGLGNLCGIRYLVDTYGDRLTAVISLDCYTDDLFVRAVGSKRYRIEATTEGGHSYFDFGKANAIAVLCGLVERLYAQPMPPEHATYNVGMMEGGTSVNTIAQQASLMYEFRSEYAAALEQMEQQLRSALDDAACADVTVTCTLIGDRPCAQGVDECRQAALVDTVRGVMAHHGQPTPLTKSGSTDCNLPLSRGIPAVCFGTITGGGMHTREEFVHIDSVRGGVATATELLLSLG